MKHFAIVAVLGLALCIAAPPAYAQTKSALGMVKSVSANQLVITGGGKDWTFIIGRSTKFSGKGVTKRAPVLATDVLREGDQVVVSYHDVGRTPNAESVRITGKSAVKK
jgi:hypothetical protein